MGTAAPRIEVLDAAQVSLSSKVVMPRRIRAHFDRAPAVAIEIEVVDRTPIVRTVTIWSESNQLVSNDLRLPLSGELLPAAVRAACSTVLFGPTPDEAYDIVVPEGVEVGEAGLIGPMRVVARIRRDRDKYGRAAADSLLQKRGRPAKQIPTAELKEIAATYKKTGSFTKTASKHDMSRSTARRRIMKAREEGMDC